MAGEDGSRIKLMYADYRRLPDDGRRHEILDGEHHVSPAPKLYHQSVLLALGSELRAQIEEQGLGRVYIAPADLQLSEVDILQPDLMVIASHRRHILTPTKVKGAPDLVVEVLSPSTEALDRGQKLERYAEGCVPEYWIVDPAEHVLEQYVLKGGEYQLVGKHETEVRPRAMAQACLELRKLW